jgi:hypothetical protein
MTLPQVLYIHQVLYQVVIKANNKDIGFDEALKIISDSVNGAGTLMSMHVLSVLTLTGNCLNRDFLRRASLTDACKKNVREKLFPGQEITQTQMKTALNGVVRKLGMSEYLVENLLCESIRKEPGFDTFHPSQSIFFLDENTDNIYCVSSSGIVEERSEEDDQRKLSELPLNDCVVPYHQWWKAKVGMDGVHEWYLNDCREKGVDPKSIIMRPHVNSSNGKKHNTDDVWDRYIRQINRQKNKGKHTLAHGAAPGAADIVRQRRKRKNS